MNKVMIISDTHKNQTLLRQVFEQADYITHVFHLGDDYHDLEEKSELLQNRILLKVPGLFDEGYLDGSHPRIQTVEIEGWKFQLVHFVKDIKQLSTDIPVVFYGHTHRWNFKKLDDHYFINPGHLKNYSDRGREATYLIMDVNAEKLVLNLYNLEHKSIHNEIIFK